MSRVFMMSGLLLLAAGPALAQDYQAQVDSQVRSAEAAYRAVGYNRVLGTGSNSLADDAKANFTMNLSAGQRYSVFGACDKDCSDLDLKVFDPAGNQIAADTATDDVPTLSFGAASSGSYRLEVTMYACSTSPCFYAATVVGSGAQANAMISAVNSTPASGGSSYENQVRNQLDLVESTASGYTRLFRSPMMQLRKDETRDYSVTLVAGVNYMVAGVCDNDCPDMDIKLFDSSGNEVAADTATDSVPIVRHVPNKGGTYRVRAIMYNCTANPCWAGLSVMAGGGR
jgi:type II secretory pathway pseudopilin PulG